MEHVEAVEARWDKGWTRWNAKTGEEEHGILVEKDDTTKIVVLGTSSPEPRGVLAWSILTGTSSPESQVFTGI